VQTEEHTQFRLNPQALVMVIVSMLALGLPIAAVLLFAMSFRPASERSAAPDPGLTQTLEGIATQALAPKALESGDREAIRIQATDVPLRAAGITKLARSVGGSAMPASAENEGERLWVSIPEKRVPAFTEACLTGVEELEFPAVGENEARVLIEIVVQQNTP
jgi:hypothetical protein